MALRRSTAPPLTKKEMAKKFCYGVFITSVWLGVNGVFWICMNHVRHSIKVVDFDYGDFFLYEGDLDHQQQHVDYEDQAEDEFGFHEFEFEVDEEFM